MICIRLRIRKKGKKYTALLTTDICLYFFYTGNMLKSMRTDQMDTLQKSRLTFFSSFEIKLPRNTIINCDSKDYGGRITI